LQRPQPPPAHGGVAEGNTGRPATHPSPTNQLFPQVRGGRHLRPASWPTSCQLLDQAREMMPREPREQPMRQYRPIYRDYRSWIMPPARYSASRALTHQLVKGSPATR
jgi:hypothetical protein